MMNSPKESNIVKTVENIFIYSFPPWQEKREGQSGFGGHAWPIIK